MSRVVKRTLSVLGADLPTVGLLGLVFVAAPTGLLAWFQYRVMSESLSNNPAAAIGDGGAYLLAAVLVWVASAIAYASAIKVAVGRLDGRPLGFAEAVASGAPHCLMIMLINLLIGLAVILPLMLITGLGIALFARPGAGAAGVAIFMVLAVPAMLVVAIMMFIRWSAAIPARVAEGLGPAASMGRSARLTKGHRWAIFGLIVALGLVVGLVEGTFLTLAGAPMDLLDPKKAGAVGAILGPVLQLFTFPLTAVGIASIYAELRGDGSVLSTAEVFS